jgi:hypothetical protein
MFADQRSFSGYPNFGDVVQSSFAVVGLRLVLLLRSNSNTTSAVCRSAGTLAVRLFSRDSCLRLGSVLTCAQSNARLVWDSADGDRVHVAGFRIIAGALARGPVCGCCRCF